MTGDGSVEVVNLSKAFGATQALRDVSLRIAPGEVVGLVGDNGAGKSTLIKHLSGVHRPDGGEIVVGGVHHDHLTAERAHELGIETIHQDLGLVEELDVAANLFLNREIVHRSFPLRALGFLDRKRMGAEAGQALERFGLKPGIVRRPVRELSGGQRQMVAVARAVHWRPSVVMMDEPTAALAVNQAARVLSLIRRLAADQIGVLLVSHDMTQVLEVTDRIVVLRHGAKAADLVTSQTSHQEVVMYMTGHAAPGAPS